MIPLRAMFHILMSQHVQNLGKRANRRSFYLNDAMFILGAEPNTM
jgi:hypothetical protein